MQQEHVIMQSKAVERSFLVWARYPSIDTIQVAPVFKLPEIGQNCPYRQLFTVVFLWDIAFLGPIFKLIQVFWNFMEFCSLTLAKSSISLDFLL